MWHLILSFQLKRYFKLTIKLYQIHAPKIWFRVTLIWGSVKMASMKWNFELTVFELTVHFNIEKIGKLQWFWKKFELSGTSY